MLRCLFVIFHKYLRHELCIFVSETFDKRFFKHYTVKVYITGRACVFFITPNSARVLERYDFVL